MPAEIERRFVVHAAKLPDLDLGRRIYQGYVAKERGNTVRSRIVYPGPAIQPYLARGYLTVKGPGTIEKPEYEYPVPAEDALDMINGLCLPAVVEKIRHVLPAAAPSSPRPLRWEVDVFLGVHRPVVLAEVELPARDTAFEVPDWVGPEVTEDPEYTNEALARSGRVPDSWYRLVGCSTPGGG